MLGCLYSNFYAKKFCQKIILEQLLTTKLFIPKTRTDLIPRLRLIERLNDGLAGKLILVSAPAGYGKTTLITSWICELNTSGTIKVCWLSLDEDDSVPRQFFYYLAAAVRSLPGVQTNLPQLLQTNQPMTTKVLMRAFVQDVTPVSTSFILVLDDYHMLDSAEVDGALAALLDLMPPQMTLVLTSRSDPGFPISRIRARGELLELRADDLRFSTDETAAFLEQNIQRFLSPAQVAALERRTEGWITGLKMAALSMKNQSESRLEDFVQNFTGSHRFIMDYLSDEVLAQLTPDVRGFLLPTAVLHHVCAGLCDAILPSEYHGHSQAYLEQLENTNTFLISLDDERRWYRYHHLFADLLRQKLPAADARAARRSAALWSAENDLIPDAIEYALAAQAWDIAVPLLEKRGLSFVFSGQHVTLQHWLDSLPPDVLLEQPRLCLDYAWTLVNQGQNEDVEVYLMAAEKASQCAPDVRAVTAIIRANSARVNEDLPVMRAEAALALEFAPAENALVRGTALLQLGAALILDVDGDMDAAVTTLRQAVRLARQSGNVNTGLLSGGYLGLAHLLRGDAFAAMRAMQETQTFAAERNLEQSPLLAYKYLGEAYLALSEDNLKAARNAVETALSRARDAGEISALFRGTLLLALLEQAAGDPVAAATAFVTARETAVQLKNDDVPRQIQYVQNVLDQTLPPLAAAVQTARLLAVGASLAYARLLNEVDASQMESSLAEALSERELQILGLIADGLKNQEIAERMFISLNTVLYHIKNIYAKLGVNKRTQAVLKARELNLL